MDDPGNSEPVTSDVPPGKPMRPRRRRWPWVLGLGVIVVPVLLFALWTTIALRWSYSEGHRAGYLQKFSRKGYLCKTWEGELQVATIPGSAPQVFLFSVRNDSIANQLAKVTGSRIDLLYEEHHGVPSSCFGDTPYYATGVRVVP